MERTPPFPADADNAMELIAFVGNIKEREEWLSKATAVIKRNEALVQTLGKAKNIDKLHSEAQSLKDTVLSAIEARETALATDREAFNGEMTTKRAEFVAEQQQAGARTQAQAQEASEALNAAKAERTAASAALRAAKDDKSAAEKDRKEIAVIRSELTELRDKTTALSEALGV